jgi:hypothetical protein
LGKRAHGGVVGSVDDDLPDPSGHPFWSRPRTWPTISESCSSLSPQISTWRSLNQPWLERSFKRTSRMVSAAKARIVSTFCTHAKGGTYARPMNKLGVLYLFFYHIARSETPSTPQRRRARRGRRQPRVLAHEHPFFFTYLAICVPALVDNLKRDMIYLRNR